jgi:hypothetical protein
MLGSARGEEQSFGEDKHMATTEALGFRVDFRPVAARDLCESTGRIHHLTAKGCYISSPTRPDSGAELELRLYIPDTSWPLCVTKAHVTWQHWDSFSVEFDTLPGSDQTVLHRVLAGRSG